MNLQNSNFDYVEQPRPDSQQLASSRPESNHSDATLRPSQDDGGRIDDDLVDYGYAPSHLTSSPSPQPTVIPHAPSPPSLFSSSETEIYGPDRLSGPAVVAQAAYARPVVVQAPVRRATPDLPPLLPFFVNQPPAWEAGFNAAMLTDFRDDVARLAGIVTPGVDDTPYIQYAIEALTRDRDTGYSAEGDASSSTSGGGDVPVTRFFAPGQRTEYQQPPQLVPQDHQWQPQQEAHASGPAPIPMPVPVPLPVPFPSHPQQTHIPAGQVTDNGRRFHNFEPNRRDSADSLASTLLKAGNRPAQPHEWTALDRDAIVARIGGPKTNGLPQLNFRPLALRTPSLIAFMTLCLMMIAALIFCAIYSHVHHGLLAYTSIYGGQYFLFRILPQLLSAVILLYSQFIIASMFRILPFARLASEEPEEREGAIFQDLYLKSFLWPRLDGPWTVWVPSFIAWLMNFTIPLQSSLFTVIWVDDAWKWGTVQGIAWALVALYLALFFSTIIIERHWATVEKTGLMWDPRSLADIIAMVSDTNTADDYRGTQIAGTRDGIRFALRRQTNVRLGYWTWRDGRPGFWYTLGTPTDNASSAPVLDQLPGKGMMKQQQQKHHHHDKEKQAMMTSAGLFTGEHDVEVSVGASPQARYRHLPWCLRSNQLLYFVITAFVLLLALFVVSFLPSTHVTRGFLPWLSAAPGRGAFSAADFLYSFLPSLLGMIVFLLFQSLDLSLRILQPWAALADDFPRGARAEHSLLVDYAACGPIQSSLHALVNKHWRAAALSFLSTIFVLIPILAGGMFMALTAPDGVVRIFPNIGALAIVLALLVLYFVALVGLFPNRRSFRLPHAVGCLAEIVSFLANDDLLNDLSFKQCRTREEMLGKMGLTKGTPETQPRWMFGPGTGEEVTLGIRRARRFTEKRKVRKSQIRRGRGAAKGFLV
ncbi:hypothetical protein B0H66DRAFT_66608 [Apodospora peruviana]|uniref:Phosphoribosylaminoimidazole-succinocarboxamide synthase n=1 Tax=Apodospora peruviana TaxID=516989 RepID=A0AAE0ISS8_9PEZI|nr:hypothetical protein B0H66DRAFT_66608 [Apodospora peruviana]